MCVLESAGNAGGTSRFIHRWVARPACNLILGVDEKLHVHRTDAITSVASTVAFLPTLPHCRTRQQTKVRAMHVVNVGQDIRRK